VGTVKQVWLGLCLVLMTIFFSTMALAGSDFNVTPVDNEINVLQKAEFLINITNRWDADQKYSFSSLDLNWNVEPVPLDDKVVSIKQGATKTLKFMVTPLKNLTPGIYYVPLYVDGSLGDKKDLALKIYLSPIGPAGYAPAVKVTVDMPTKINPQEPISVKLILENRNKLNLSNVEVKLNSEMEGFQKSTVVDIDPLGRKVVEMTIAPNPHQQPKEYYLEISLLRWGESFKVVDQKVEVVPLVPAFSVTDLQEDNVFLKIYRDFTIENGGNVLNTQKVLYPVSFLEGILTQGDVKVVKENGQRYLMWELTLNPGETTQKQVATNYRLLLYLFIITALVVGFYLYVRSPITIKKTASIVKKDDKGATSEIKVVIEVKNPSSKTVKDVTLTDIIPGYAVFEKNSSDDNAILPQKTTHSKEGTKVHWTLSELDGKDHRVMNYHMKAKLNILGSVRLPRASAEFVRASGRRGKAYSGRFNVGEK
jgi:uncharacterized repeat protein (TIGR01451 family)